MRKIKLFESYTKKAGYRLVNHIELDELKKRYKAAVFSEENLQEIESLFSKHIKAVYLYSINGPNEQYVPKVLARYIAGEDPTEHLKKSMGKCQMIRYDLVAESTIATPERLLIYKLEDDWYKVAARYKITLDDHHGQESFTETFFCDEYAGLYNLVKDLFRYDIDWIKKFI